MHFVVFASFYVDLYSCHRNLILWLKVHQWAFFCWQFTVWYPDSYTIVKIEIRCSAESKSAQCTAWLPLFCLLTSGRWLFNATQLHMHHAVTYCYCYYYYWLCIISGYYKNKKKSFVMLRNFVNVMLSQIFWVVCFCNWCRSHAMSLLHALGLL